MENNKPNEVSASNQSDSNKIPYQVFAGESSKYFGELICKKLGCPLGKCSKSKFADGEFSICFEDSVRGRDVFLVQSTFSPTENLMELLLMIDAAKRASAHRVIAVMPYFGWARQDRKDKPRVPIGAKLVADMLSVAGIDRLITMDLHADQIQGFFDIPVDHLYGSLILVPYIKTLNLQNLIIAAPDAGASKRAALYSKKLNVPLVLCNKTRVRANEVESITIIGDVKDKDVVLVDDLVDTAGTITMAANKMKEAGARSVRAVATHCIMSDPASERIENSVLEEIVFTESIPFRKKCSKVRQFKIAPYFAEAIRSIEQNDSLSNLVDFEKGYIPEEFKYEDA